MYYPKMISAGSLDDCQENCNRFLMKYHDFFDDVQTVGHSYSDIKGDKTGTLYPTHTLTIKIKFKQHVVGTAKQQEILGASTAKYDNFEHLKS